ncbi:MAG: prepilin-type N-terminal cleavage/methylation domain-containing protein [Selenomonadaceae bacterium]|nr:prepilin-type N-terminal cleavage/methylation domain-containing protein [Selenomonadaceae bacterium]
MNQRGFATLEIILAIVILSIIATIAVPRFTDTKTRANTAKIQADLSTIDTALQIRYLEKGNWTGIDSVENLVTEGYLMEEPKPPTGSAFMGGTSTEIDATTTTYHIDTTNNQYRAALKMNSKANAHAGDFSK